MERVMSDRRAPISLSLQLQHAMPLAVVWAIGLAALWLATAQDTVPLEKLFLDPATLAGEAWYTGLLANVGVLGWSVAVVAVAGGAWVSLRAGRPTAVTFSASAALITALLLLDDLLQIHAVILPSTGMNPTTAQLLIAAPAPLWMWLHRAEIERTRWLLLVAALGGFAVSLGADLFVEGAGSARLLVEDGAKLLGIIAWAQYFVLTARDITGSVIAAALGYTDRAWSIDEPVRIP